jgi:hypothetical protein
MMRRGFDLFMGAREASELNNFIGVSILKLTLLAASVSEVCRIKNGIIPLLYDGIQNSADHRMEHLP